MNPLTEKLIGEKSMLLQFKFANYRSFADETVFDMTATPIREHKNSLIEHEKSGVKVLPVAGIYGANASGKSSFFMAIEAMCNLVTGNETSKHNFIESHDKSFIFDPAYADKSTEYEVCLAINDYEYRYGFEHIGEKIICEYLYKRKLSKNNTVEKIIFERFGKKVTSDAPAKLKKEIDYCASMCVERSLLLTDLGRRSKILELLGIYLWFDAINFFTFASNNELPPTLFNDKEQPYSDIIDFLKNTLSLINEMDNSIVTIKSVKEETRGIYILKSVHKYGDREIEVPFSIESDGTKKLLSIAYCAFLAIATGGSYFVDELDMRLHPLLLRKIVHMFKNKEINKNGAQLIFSAHNIINLDSSSLRRDEVWFVEKNDHKSTMFSLYDFEDEGGSDIRSDLDYGKHYLLGRFGAIPFQDKDGDE